MGSEKLGTCDERVRHTWDEVTGEVPHRLSGMCRNWREQPQGEATLSELLESARKHTMTPEEKEAQRQSWVRGEAGLDRPGDYGSTSVFPPAPTEGGEKPLVARELAGKAFTITYHSTSYYCGYKVSIPNYAGGEVVTLADAEAYADQRVRQEREARERAEKALLEAKEPAWESLEFIKQAHAYLNAKKSEPDQALVMLKEARKWAEKCKRALASLKSSEGAK